MFGCPTDQCDEPLSSNAEVIRAHMHRVHKTLDPLPCKQCDKVFLSADSLKCHLKMVHVKREEAQE